jgi:hypothetical protein
MPRQDKTPSTTIEHAQAPNLTLGVEFEFIFVSMKVRPDHGQLWPSRLEDLAEEVVNKALKDDLTSVCNSCGETFTWKLDTDEYLPELERWAAEREPVVAGNALDALPHPERYFATGIEVRSRILDLRLPLKIPKTGSTHDHELTYEQEIEAVLLHLQKRFCTFTPGQERCDYLFPSTDSSVHLHVGQGSAGFTLEEVKRVMNTSIGCERLIDQFHAVNRITGTDHGILPLADDFGNQWIDRLASNAPLSLGLLQHAYRRRAIEAGLVTSKDWHDSTGRYPVSSFDIYPGLRELSKAFDIDSWMTLVEEAPNLLALKHLYPVAARDSTVNINNLRPTGKKTIEFRQHAGTMQAKAVLSWLDVVVHLVWYSIQTTDMSLIDLIYPDFSQAPLRRPGATWRDLCNVIGCQPSTIGHFENQETGVYAQNLRHEECQQAKEASNDPLAAVALYNIAECRKMLHPANVRQRVNEKLLYGGYGQFPKEVVDALVGHPVSDDVKAKITLGYEAPKSGTGLESRSKFSENKSRPGSSGSERSYYSNPDVALRTRRDELKSQMQDPSSRSTSRRPG